MLVNIVVVILEFVVIVLFGEVGCGIVGRGVVGGKVVGIELGVELFRVRLVEFVLYSIY